MACVGVWGVGVEWVSWVGQVDGWCALGRVSGSCAVDFRDVLWSVRRELLGINGGLWGGGVCGDEVPKNGGVGWCWDVDVVLRRLCAFRL